MKITDQMVEAAARALCRRHFIDLNFEGSLDDIVESRSHAFHYDALAVLSAALEAAHLAAGEAGEGVPVAWGYELAHFKHPDGSYSGWDKRLSYEKPNVPEGSIRNLVALAAATVPPAGAMDAGAAPQDRLPRDRDIILEAINEYDGWLKDDDYDSKACLARIMGRMRDRALGGTANG